MLLRLQPWLAGLTLWACWRVLVFFPELWSAGLALPGLLALRIPGSLCLPGPLFALLLVVGFISLDCSVPLRFCHLLLQALPGELMGQVSGDGNTGAEG